MEWFSKIQKQAQEAAELLISSEAAERARELAAQATQQATVFAQQATVKAQEVAKEAIGEAEKSIFGLGGQGSSQAAAAGRDPAQYGITPELERFVCSLTYSTFSEYPLDSLDVPSAPEQQRLNSWQETHARLMLQRVQQLQDLRFVLCPKNMDEYMFWLIYFTLCKRYLPQQQHQAEDPETAAVAAAGAAAAAAAAGGAAVAHSSGGDAAAAAAGSSQSQGDGGTAASQGAGAASAAAGAGAGAGAAPGEAEQLVELGDDDPELTAYLQDALQLDGKAGEGDDSGELGSDMDDLDDYLTQLDAEVNAPK